MDAKEVITAAVWLCSSITTITAAVLLIFKPVRQKVLGNRSEEDGVKCLLRSDMLRVYYNNRERKQIRQYEYENFIMEYKAYKVMKGNSFIDHIKSEVDDWEVIT